MRKVNMKGNIGGLDSTPDPQEEEEFRTPLRDMDQVKASQAKLDLAPPDAEKGGSRDPATMEAPTHSRHDTAVSAAKRVRTLCTYITILLYILLCTVLYVSLYEYIIIVFLPGE